MVVANIQFFAVRLNEYGKRLSIYSPALYLDVTMLFLVPIPMLAYIYRAVYGALIVG